ncbi:MAG: hypothetical protein WCU88_10375 [Elusimicrobiota bacterium]
MRSLSDPKLAKLRNEQTWEYKLFDGRNAQKIRRDYETRGGRLWKQYWFVLDGRLSQFLPQDIFNLFPLYAADRLPAASEQEAVVVCEGEKAADALLARGIAAVGTQMGATYTPTRRALNALTGRPVLLWPDNDPIGRRHMEQVAIELSGSGHENIRIIDWKDAPARGDAADFTGSEQELRALLAQAGSWTPPEDARNGSKVALTALPFKLESRGAPSPKLSTPNPLALRRELSQLQSESKRLSSKSAQDNLSLEDRLRAKRLQDRLEQLIGSRTASISKIIKPATTSKSKGDPR